MNCMNNDMEHYLDLYKYDENSVSNEFVKDISPCENNFQCIKARGKRKKRRNKRERELKYKRKLIKLSNLPYYPCGSYYHDEIFVKGVGYIENPKPYYIRYYKGKGYTRLKKISNRKVRRDSRNLYHGNQYRKLYDLWNEYI